MNLVDVEEDVKEIAHLDFDLVCHVRVATVLQMFGVLFRVGVPSRPCGAPAVGYLKCRGCSYSALACEAHGQVAVLTGPVVCSRCEKSGPASEVYVFEPLRVRS